MGHVADDLPIDFGDKGYGEIAARAKACHDSRLAAIAVRMVKEAKADHLCDGSVVLLAFWTEL